MGCQHSSSQNMSEPVGLNGEAVILDVKNFPKIAGVKEILAKVKGVAAIQQPMLLGTRLLKSNDPVPAGPLPLVVGNQTDYYSSSSMINWQGRKVKLPSGVAKVAAQAAIQAVKDAEILDKESNSVLTSKTPNTVLGLEYTLVGDDHNVILQVRFQAHRMGSPDSLEAYRQEVRIVLRERPVASEIFTVIEAALEPQVTTNKLHRTSYLDMPEYTTSTFGGYTSSLQDFELAMCSLPVFY